MHGHQAFLVCSQSGRVFPLEKGTIRVGRADPARGIQPDIDLTAEDPHRFVSRRHARLEWHNDRWHIVEEAGVRSGTYVNGRRLRPEQHKALNHQDEIRLARVELVFEEFWD